MRFFIYDQNNSGGIFTVNDSVTYAVIIEAENADDANRRAEAIGIYFDGCEAGTDCDCCGDRWSRAYQDGTERPEIYGKPAEEYKETWGKEGSPYCHIYFADGSKQTLVKSK